MDGTTPNLNLVKPGRNGTADIEVLDQNMEKIDAWAGEKETELSGKEPTINKNSGFNKEKTDSVTTNSSVILATAKAIKTVWDALTNHRNSTSNPHTVTKSQVGLGNVPNYTITDSTTDGSSLKFGSAKAVKTVWNKALEILGLTNTNKNAIQNNTEQIENFSKISETNINMTTGTGVVNIRRIGNLIFIGIDTLNTTIYYGKIAFSLPNGFHIETGNYRTTIIASQSSTGGKSCCFRCTNGIDFIAFDGDSLTSSVGYNSYIAANKI
ncbi:hypothetical protein NRK67_00655 [Fusobacteria bacterium ZRK30]|nr:hypothetical protein NRK67_00655 [Fusobacteria bacterium ZRK30]